MTADLEELLREGLDRLTADAKLGPEIIERAQHEEARRREPGAVISPRRRADGRWRHWRRPQIRIVAPLAAAAAMACVAVAVALAGHGGQQGHGGPRATATLPGGTPAPRPPFFLGCAQAASDRSRSG